LCNRGKSEGVDIHTIDTIEIEQETDTPKPVKKRGRRPKIKEESMEVSIPNVETVHNEVDKDDIVANQKCSSVDNLIEMLEDDDNDKDGNITNVIEEDCSPKLIRPADIKREQLSLIPELDNIDEDDLDGCAMLDDDDDSDYEGNEVNDDLKKDNESNSPKKQKNIKNSIKKKAPEILIP